MPELPAFINGRPTQLSGADSGLTCDDTPPAGLLAGIVQFNRGEFFECHETLEEIWREERAPVRFLYQGILQVGVSFHHLRHGNYLGATRLMVHALNYLRPFGQRCMGVEVARLVADAEAAQATMLQLGSQHIRQFDMTTLPQVHLTDSPPLPTSPLAGEG